VDPNWEWKNSLGVEKLSTCVGGSGCSGFSPDPLLLTQPGTASKPALHGENKSLGHPLLRLETCHTSSNSHVETSATVAEEDKESRAVPRGQPMAGGGVEDQGNTPAETIPARWVYSAGQRTKQDSIWECNPIPHWVSRRVFSQEG